MAVRKKRARCVVCGKPIGFPYEWTPVHSQNCGHTLALRLVESVPGVLDLLPPKWRADLHAEKRLRKRRPLTSIHTDDKKKP